MTFAIKSTSCSFGNEFANSLISIIMLFPKHCWIEIPKYLYSLFDRPFHFGFFHTLLHCWNRGKCEYRNSNASWKLKLRKSLTKFTYHHVVLHVKQWAKFLSVLKRRFPNLLSVWRQHCPVDLLPLSVNLGTTSRATSSIGIALASFASNIRFIRTSLINSF